MWKFVIRQSTAANVHGLRMNRSVRPSSRPLRAALSRARTTVVPTATTRPASRLPARRAWTASHTAGGIRYASLCMTWSAGSPAVTGRNVSRPTTRSRETTSAPADDMASITASVRCSPAVGAATDPGVVAKTVW